MSGPADSINSISKMISDGNADSAWKIEKKDLCDDWSIVSFQSESGKCERGQSFHIKATYKSENGAELVLSGSQPKGGLFQPAGIRYSATINRNKIVLADFSTDNSEATTSDRGVTRWNPDGKITEGENLVIDGMNYFLRGGSDGVFTFTAPFKETDKETNHKYEYDRLGFSKNEDNWISDDQSEKGKGKELEKLLEEIGIQYLSTLDEAKSHVKPVKVVPTRRSRKL